MADPAYENSHVTAWRIPIVILLGGAAVSYFAACSEQGIVADRTSAVTQVNTPTAPDHSPAATAGRARTLSETEAAPKLKRIESAKTTFAEDSAEDGKDDDPAGDRREEGVQSHELDTDEALSVASTPTSGESTQPGQTTGEVASENKMAVADALGSQVPSTDLAEDSFDSTSPSVDEEANATGDANELVLLDLTGEETPLVETPTLTGTAGVEAAAIPTTDIALSRNTDPTAAPVAGGEQKAAEAPLARPRIPSDDSGERDGGVQTRVVASAPPDAADAGQRRVPRKPAVAVLDASANQTFKSNARLVKPATANETSILMKSSVGITPIVPTKLTATPKLPQVAGPRPFLGIDISDVTTSKLTKVYANSTAAKLGLKVGDDLVKINDLEVSNLVTVRKALANLKIGVNVKVTFVSNGDFREAGPISLGSKP